MTEPKKYIKSEDGSSMIRNPEYDAYHKKSNNVASVAPVAPVAQSSGGVVGAAGVAGVAGVGSGHREGEIEKQLKEIDGIKHLLTPEEYAAKRVAILGLLSSSFSTATATAVAVPVDVPVAVPVAVDTPVDAMANASLSGGGGTSGGDFMDSLKDTIKDKKFLGGAVSASRS
jgi:hypothetical protein